MRPRRSASGSRVAIRYAKPADHPAIAAVVTAAFGRPDEADLVAFLQSL